jgi:hypothetical protein
MVDIKDDENAYEEDEAKQPVGGLTINDVETEELEAEKSDRSSDVAYYEEYKRAGEAKLKRDEEDRLIEALPDLKEKVEGRDEDELRRALAIEKQKLEQFKVADDVRWDDKKQNERRDAEDQTGSSTPVNAGSTSYPSSTSSSTDEDIADHEQSDENDQTVENQYVENQSVENQSVENQSSDQSADPLFRNN